MYKLSKFKIIFIFLLIYLGLTELFSTDWESISLEHLFPQKGGRTFFSQVDSFNLPKINTVLNNTINKNHTDSDNSTTKINNDINLEENFFSAEVSESEKEISRNNSFSIQPIIQVESRNTNKKRKKDNEINFVEKDDQKLSKQIKNNKNKSSKKNKHIRKQKAQIENTNETEEESLCEKKNESPIKKIRMYWKKSMREHLQSLVNEINPCLDESNTWKEIAQKMEEKFPHKAFTQDSVRKKSKEIGGDKTAKYTKWDEKMENRLRELKSKKENTFRIIASTMAIEFPHGQFTVESLKMKWKWIRGNSTKEPINWTEEMQSYLIKLNNKIKLSTNKKYTNKEIIQKINKKFGVNCVKKTVFDKWLKIEDTEINTKINWTPEKVNFLRKKKNKNYSYEQIANKMGEKFNQKPSELALRVKWSEVGGAQVKKRAKWTPEMVEFLKRKKAKGSTHKQISEKITEKFKVERSECAVGSKWAQLEKNKLN